MAAYADPDRDVYCETATGILGRVVTPEDKTTRLTHGKVPELALGYGGGKGAFLAMAQAYGLNLPEAQVKQIVTDWRNNQKWAPRWWKDARSQRLLSGHAAVLAVRVIRAAEFP